MGRDRSAKHGRGRVHSAGGIVFDGFWARGARHGRGVTHTPGGERQEAMYAHDRLASVPRIFFHHIRAGAPLRHRIQGASLRASFTEEDRPVRLRLWPIPLWLAAKRADPTPPADPPAVRAALSLGWCAPPAREQAGEGEEGEEGEESGG